MSALAAASREGTMIGAIRLWTMRGYVRDVSCTAEPEGEELALHVRYGDELMLCEVHAEIGELVARAEELRARMVVALCT
jgi:hypothetical protein